MGSRLSRAAAILEVVGVLIVSILLGRSVQGALGIDSWKPVQAAMIESGAPDFWRLAWLATVEQVLKYGFLLLIFWAIGRWHRNRRLADYGLRRGKRSTRESFEIGVVGWAVIGLPPLGLQLLAEFFPALGAGPDHWSLFPETWTPAFLAYMAASSFLLVPVVEEIFARGYMVTRFVEDYGQGGGLVLAAVFFALAHTQYFRLEVLSLGMLASLVFGSLVLGTIFLRTGSLVPVIVAHALVNVPLPPAPGARLAVIVAMLTVLVVARGRLGGWTRAGLNLLREQSGDVTLIGCVILAASLALVPLSGDRLPYVAGGLLVASLVAHAIERRTRVTEDGS